MQMRGPKPKGPLPGNLVVFFQLKWTRSPGDPREHRHPPCPVIGMGFLPHFLKGKAHVGLFWAQVPDSALFCFSGENLVCESTLKLRL